MRSFIHGIFNFAQEMLLPQEDRPTQIAIPKQFQQLNQQFKVFCQAQFTNEQLLTIIKGIVITLDRFLKNIDLAKIKEIKQSLMKAEGEWEDTYWNGAINHISQEYFEGILKIITAQWTVHEQTILKIVEWVYLSKREPAKPNQPNQEQLIKIRENNSDRQNLIPSQADIKPDDPLPSSRTIQPSIPKKEIDDQRPSKANSVKQSKPNQSPRPTINEPSQKDTVMSKVKQPKEPYQKSNKSPQKEEKSPNKKLGYSKLDEKIRKFKQKNE